VLAVERAGGANGAVSVTLEVVPATADAGDGTLATMILNWNDGDAVAKTARFDATVDADGEGLERLVVRLVAHTGGASLAPAAIASVFVSDAGAGSEVGFATAGISVPERGFNTAVVVFTRSGSAAGAASVDYAVTGGDASAGADFDGPVTGSVTWADGDALPKWIEFTIADDGSVENDETIELSLLSATGAAIGRGSSVVTLNDGAGSNVAPNAVAGASRTVAEGSEVTLDGSASNDPDGDALAYAWQQSLGPSVTLSGADTATPRFTAPSVSSDTLLRFDLVVTDPRGLADTANTSVTVTAGASGGGGGGTSTLAWLLTLALMLMLTRTRCAAIRTDAALRSFARDPRRSR
jgi:hypothetical protein